MFITLQSHNYTYIHKQEKELIKKLIEECTLISRLHHPHIVQFLGICYRSGSHLPLLIMERLPTDLHTYLETTSSVPLSAKASFLKDVAQGLSFLHSHTPPIVHGNLTGRNVLLNSQMVAKIADLRISRIRDIVPHKIVHSTSGMYMPPESLVERELKYTTEADVFSFGALSLFSLTQRFPKLKKFKLTDESLATNAVSGQEEVEHCAKCLKKIHQVLGKQHLLVQLVEQCLQDNPTKRPSVATILETLSQVLITRGSTSLVVLGKQPMRVSTQSQGEDMAGLKHRSGRPSSDASGSAGKLIKFIDLAHSTL